MEEPRKPLGQQRAGRSTAFEYANLGFQFAISVALGYWGGGWAGRRWNWPWAEDAGALLGVVVGFWMLVRAAMEWEKRDRPKG